MAVISISIIESPVQRVDGIPLTITLTSNIPATIFYTLDGVVATTSSTVAIGAITMPSDVNSVTLNYFATNGVITSPNLSRRFGPDLVNNNLRRPRDKVSGLNQTCNDKSPLFGGGSSNGSPIYGNTAGEVVNNPLLPQISNAFDDVGNPALFTNKPWTLENYEIVFSETNAIGEKGHGIGTLPAEATLYLPPPLDPSSSSETNSKFFNPNAIVIIQDGTKESFDPEHPITLRRSFSLVNNNTRYGANYYTTGSDGSSPSANMCQPQYNNADGTVTFSYRDRDSNRWIFSKEKYTPNAKATNLANIVFGRGQGVGFIFKWIPNQYRTLW